MTRFFVHIEPDENGHPVNREFSEDELIEKFYGDWVKKMKSRRFKNRWEGNKGLSQITKENFLEDWKTIHWAWEYKIDET